jgi:predicted transcriptional regulator
MKAIELNMPDDVYEKLENLASQDHQSVDAFALQKLEEFTRAFEDFRELERGAQRGNREKFDSAMAKIPSAPPMAGDELDSHS